MTLCNEYDEPIILNAELLANDFDRVLHSIVINASVILYRLERCHVLFHVFYCARLIFVVGEIVKWETTEVPKVVW